MFGHNQFNWNPIQHLMAEGDYGWKQTGQKDAQYTANDPECLTDFKSNVEIIGPNGEPIRVTESVPSDMGFTPTWENLPKGSKIKWSAKTYGEDKEPASDRVQVELVWLDSNYIAKIVSDVIEKLSDAEQDMFLTDTAKISAIIQEKVMEVIDFSLVMKTIYSTVLASNDNGYLEGEIPIAPQWPKGNYSMTIRYGYHAQSESSDAEKAYQFWVVEWGVTIIELIIAAILFFFCPPCGLGVAVLLFTTAVIAECAIMYFQYQKTAFGMTGLNKYDCAFPDGGWNHIYAFGYDIEEAEDELADQASPLTVNILQGQMETYIDQNGILASILGGTAIMGLGLILVTRLKQKGRKSDGS